MMVFEELESSWKAKFSVNVQSMLRAPFYNQLLWRWSAGRSVCRGVFISDDCGGINE